MTEEYKTKIAATLATAKDKAMGIVSKENIDNVKKGVKSGVDSLKTAEGRKRLKESAIAAAAAAKDKVYVTWKSGPRGKAIIAGCLAALAFCLIGWLGCGDNDGAGPDGSYSSRNGWVKTGKYRSAPEMVNVKATPCGPVIKGFYLGMTIPDFLDAYNGKYGSMKPKGYNNTISGWIPGGYELHVEGGTFDYHGEAIERGRMPTVFDNLSMDEKTTDTIVALIKRYYPNVKYELQRSERNVKAIYVDSVIYVKKQPDSGIGFYCHPAGMSVFYQDGCVSCLRFTNMNAYFNVDGDMDKATLFAAILKKYKLNPRNVNVGVGERRFLLGGGGELTDKYEYIDRVNGFALRIDEYGSLELKRIQKTSDIDL